MRKIRTKSSNKRKLILNIFLFLFLLIGVGYSTIFTNLGINGDIVLLNYRDLNIKQTSSTDRTAFRSDTYRENIKTITINDSISAPSNVIESWDISENGSGGVMAYIVQNTVDNNKYDLYIQGRGRIYTNQNSSYLFYGLTSLETINGLNKLTTSKTTNMSNMFSGDSNLTILDLSNFNMFRVTNTTDMLTGDTNLSRIKTPKIYSSNAIITLTKNLYDNNDISYSTLNNSSPTETWISAKYTVTFNSNGGNVGTSTMTVKYGEEYGNLPTATKTGHYFLGWNGKNMFDNNSYYEKQPSVTCSNNKYIFDGSATSNNPFGAIRIQKYHNSTDSTDSLDICTFGESTLSNNRYSCTFQKTSDFDKIAIRSNTPVYDPLMRIDVSLENNKTYVLSFNVDYFNKNESKLILKNIQIEESNTASAYEPYYIEDTTIVVKNEDHTLEAIWGVDDAPSMIFNNGTSNWGGFVVSPYTSTDSESSITTSIGNEMTFTGNISAGYKSADVFLTSNNSYSLRNWNNIVFDYDYDNISGGYEILIVQMYAIDENNDEEEIGEESIIFASDGKASDKNGVSTITISDEIKEKGNIKLQIRIHYGNRQYAVFKVNNIRLTN